jgi:hypothetical protein
MNNEYSVAAGVCLAVCLGVLGAAWPAHAQGGKVISVPTGGNLQAAINAAAPGDTIQLQPGGTYIGNFVLPKKSGTAFVTIRTAPDPRQPGDRVRVLPKHAPGLALLRSGNTSAVIRTSSGAHRYRLMLLELGANSHGFGDIVQLGQADDTQTSLDQVPSSLVLDRLYIHGDPLIGQKRGIALNSASTEIVNCYISDIKAVGQDTQAIAAMNGPGPYLIENNYLEAAAENFMAGGADPRIVNLIPSDITFRYNHLSKPLTWRDPIVPTPAGVKAAVSGPGALLAGTYAYQVVAERMAAPGVTARSRPSASVSVTVAGGTRAIAVTWVGVPTAATYTVYRRFPGGADQYWTTSSTSIVDDGSAGTVGSPGAATTWAVKNIFELKNARRVLVERNVMEHNWKAAQSGFAIVLTPRNSGGACTWCAIEDVTFRFNILRHVGAGVNVLGTDDGSPSGQARGLTFRDNLIYDVNTRWGGHGWLAQLGEGPADMVFDHNTIDHNGSSVIYAYGSTTMPGFQMTNNLARHNDYGIFGSGAALGTPILTRFFPGAIVTHNVLAGGPASSYPGGNLFPSVASHMAQFNSPSTGDYSLTAGSSYGLAGLDGKDLGANITEIERSAAVALSGLPAGSVRITTTELPRATVGVSLSVTLNVTGGSGRYIWSISGALPAGLQFNPTTATLSGVPAQYGAWLITFTATDANASSNATTQPLTLSVWPSPVRIAGSALPGATAGRPASGVIFAAGGTGSYRWRIVSGALPTGISIDASTGTLSGTPVTAGTFPFTVGVSDVIYPDLSAQSRFSIAVAAAPVAKPDIVLYARDATVLAGTWQVMIDATAAAGASLGQTDRGASKLPSALPSPVHYFEMPFTAEPGTAYHLWIRGKAQNNFWGNDSVFVQFSGSVIASGEPTFRVGTGSAMIVNLEDGPDVGVSAWGWQDNGYGVNVLGTPIYFDGTPQKLRIQTREDGFSIDQIVLSPATYFNLAPGALKNDTTILSPTSGSGSMDSTEIVLRAEAVTTLAGRFHAIGDATASEGVAIGTSDAGLAKLTSALAAPADYVELTFQARANVAYRLWIRGKAESDSWANDSVFVQFSNSVDAAGMPIYRIGTASGTAVILEDDINVGVRGWGWQDNGWGANVLGPLVYFAKAGTQTIRVQVREDGYSFDQITLSSQKYVAVAPGALKNDTTILK